MALACKSELASRSFKRAKDREASSLLQGQLQRITCFQPLEHPERLLLLLLHWIQLGL